MAVTGCLSILATITGIEIGWKAVMDSPGALRYQLERGDNSKIKRIALIAANLLTMVGMLAIAVQFITMGAFLWSSFSMGASAAISQAANTAFSPLVWSIGALAGAEVIRVLAH